MIKFSFLHQPFYNMTKFNTDLCECSIQIIITYLVFVAQKSTQSSFINVYYSKVSFFFFQPLNSKYLSFGSPVHPLIPFPGSQMT